MKQFLFLLLASIGFTFFQGCASSSSFAKKANQLEIAGLYEEAANFHYIALLKNPNNIDAKIGLRNNGQKVLDDKFMKFYQAHGAEQHKAAVYAFMEATEYKEKFERFVRMDYAPYYDTYFEESKQAYLNEMYLESNQLIEEGKFEQAEVLLKEIAKFDPFYNDVSSLQKISRIEPKYQEGIEAMNIGNYLKAYHLFNEIIEIKGRNYKDALNLREEAREKANIRIAILPFDNKASETNPEIADNFYGKIVQTILNYNNGFVRLIDRKNMERIIEEQKLGMTGLVDQSSAARAGRLMGAQVVLVAKINEYSVTEGKIDHNTEKGYLRNIQRQFNPKGGYYFNATVWDKVEYEITRGETSVNISFEFQLISTETGEILTGDLFKQNGNDQIAFASFEGSHQNLFPGTWESRSLRSPNDQVFTSVAEKQQLDRLLSSRKRVLKSADELKWSIIDDIAQKTADNIMNYVNNR